MERREHHRAHLRLPVRLRWNTPLGQRTEIATTLDVSRGGLRVPCESAHSVGVSLWVTFPYDETLGEGQPEVLARVMRSMPPRNGQGARNGAVHHAQQRHREEITSVVALNFHPKGKTQTNGTRNASQRERRMALRRVLAVPIHVRPQGIPWFEETMTVDLSTSGLRFSSNREYQVGDILLVSFDSSVSLHWASETEVPFRVVRLEAAPQTAVVTIALSRVKKTAPISSVSPEIPMNREARS
jgi:PilZ domain